MPSLLPHATPLERALEAAAAQRLSGLEAPADTLAALWDPQTCPAALLPWLAWALGVDAWNPAWPEGTKRLVLSKAIELHRRRGPVGAVRGLLQSFGYDVVAIEEGLPLARLDGSVLLDGTETLSGDGHWALWRAVLDLGTGLTLDAGARQRILDALARVAPARCHLRDIGWTVGLSEWADAREAPHTAVAWPVEAPWAARPLDGARTLGPDVLRLDGAAALDGAASLGGVWPPAAPMGDVEALDVAVGTAWDEPATRPWRLDAALPLDGQHALAGQAPSPADAWLGFIATQWLGGDGIGARGLASAARCQRDMRPRGQC